MFRPWSSRRGSRLLVGSHGAGAVALFVVALAGTSGIAASASGESVAHATSVNPAPCSPSILRETTTVNRTSYPPGTVVRMTISIRNASTAACSVGVGPTSPSFSVTNSRGAEVWNSCYVNDQPGACAQYLMARSLAPGAAYAKTLTWDQRSGAPPARVPVGVYTLSTHFEGGAGNHVVRFKLTGAVARRTLSVTQADSGHSYTLHVGDRLVVQLSGPSIYTWTESVSSNPAVLARSRGSSGATTTAIFVARAKGRARVTATDNPNCYPQCLPPSRLFVVTVTVLG
jgi:hypothetical protein